ncbi:unnamed protein product [Strongylus vulgaris]|uniref:Uncharacterized protein n=1 Tax=Strongylus vulgaris TaxID=40348 RepID=A0A3P7JMA0_STRVU|nr:unnamed protein product [Strongylus vulgaris]
MSAFNMWHSYAVKKTFKQSSLYEAFRPIFSSVALFAISLTWAALSPTDVCSQDPRCRLIIAQMSNHRCEVMNMLLVLYAMFAVNSYGHSTIYLGLSFVMPYMELVFLRIMCFLVVVLHVHYGVCVDTVTSPISYFTPISFEKELMQINVRQLCAHFKIHALDNTLLE